MLPIPTRIEVTMANDENVLLDVRSLKVIFPLDEGTVRAVEGVDLVIKRGQVMGVVGESGCGKTVTAQSIMRIVPDPGRIEQGEILFHRRSSNATNEEVIDIAKLDPRGSEIRSYRGKEVAMIFQEPLSSFSPLHTIGNQIMEAVLLHQDVNKNQARELAKEMLTRVGIPNPSQRLDQYPHEFSGGMRQRAMIAMALTCKPALLIADEPTTALDVTIQAQILDLMKELQDEFGMAINHVPGEGSGDRIFERDLSQPQTSLHLQFTQGYPAYRENLWATSSGHRRRGAWSLRSPTGL